MPPLIYGELNWSVAHADHGDGHFKSSPVSRIICVTDKFKGTLPASEIGLLAQKTWGDRCLAIPLADGGEGTLEALHNIRPWTIHQVRVVDPCYQPRDAYYLIDPTTNTAYLEMALASGLQLVPAEQRDPKYTTTMGTGQLILDAWTQGVNRIVVFAGGSATQDAGIGLLAGCGYEWLDEKGNPLDPQGDSLSKIASVREPSDLPPQPEFLIATDVRNPLLGPLGAARQFAAQKGATPEDIDILETGTRQYLHWLENRFGQELDQPGMGAAGGLALSPAAFWNTRIVSATDLIFDLLAIEQHIASADIILTGEGKLDQTSLQGKLIHAVCQLALRHRKIIWGVFGEVTLPDSAVRELGLSQWFSLTSLAGSSTAAMEDPRHWMQVALRLFRD